MGKGVKSAGFPFGTDATQMRAFPERISKGSESPRARMQVMPSWAGNARAGATWRTQRAITLSHKLQPRPISVKPVGVALDGPRAGAWL